MGERGKIPCKKEKTSLRMKFKKKNHSRSDSVCSEKKKHNCS